MDFDRPGKVVACNVQIDHTHLQNAPVQVAYRPRFIPPDGFESLMGFEVIPGIEGFHAFNGSWMERFLTVFNSWFGQFGHIECNYNIPLIQLPRGLGMDSGTIIIV